MNHVMTMTPFYDPLLPAAAEGHAHLLATSGHLCSLWLLGCPFVAPTDPGGGGRRSEHEQPDDQAHGYQPGRAH